MPLELRAYNPNTEYIVNRKPFKYILPKGYTMNDMVVLGLKGWKCQRCGHEWLPRKKEEKPVVCPKCKSPYWNRKSKQKQVE